MAVIKMSALWIKSILVSVG